MIEKVTTLPRRSIIKGALVLSAGLALPVRAFAQAKSYGVRDAKLFEIAKREIEKAGDAIWRKDLVGIADFGVHSSKERFHFVNLEKNEIRSFLVSHGTGSDPEHDGWLNNFSNTFGSNATSRGAYVTWEWYKGRYGTSIRLGGLNPDNSAALDRLIVAHAANYATRGHVDRWGRLGRSNGCFAMGPENFREALWNLSGGRLIYADKLGLAEDGSIVTPPPPPIRMQEQDGEPRIGGILPPGL